MASVRAPVAATCSAAGIVVPAVFCVSVISVVLVFVVRVIAILDVRGWVSLVSLLPTDTVAAICEHSADDTEGSGVLHTIFRIFCTSILFDVFVPVSVVKEE
jgi:hypothetical protein